MLNLFVSYLLRFKPFISLNLLHLCLSNIDVDVDTAAENGCDDVDEHVYKTTIERRLKQRRELFDLFILNPRQFIV